jgi:hypothetical protein
MRRATRILVLLSALGSLACTLYAGHHNRSFLLVGMFAAWVGTPFVGMLAVLRGVEGASARAATLVRTLAIVVSLVSLALYFVFMLGPLGHSAAAPFLVIPVCSWVAVAAMMLIARDKNR